MVEKIHNGRPFGIRYQFDAVWPTVGDKECHYINLQAGKQKPLQLRIGMNQAGRVTLSISSNGFQWDIANNVRGFRRDWRPRLTYHFCLVHYLDVGEYALEINGQPEIRVASWKPIFGLELEKTDDYKNLSTPAGNSP